jgi:outer membrane phospholipase A
MSANIKPVTQATSSNKENDKREEIQHQISFKFLSFSVSLILMI